jgi:hypothetical protein
MTMLAEQLPRTAAAALILRIATATLITFAATIALLHAEIYFADPLITSGPMTGGF